MISSPSRACAPCANTSIAALRSRNCFTADGPTGYDCPATTAARAVLHELLVTLYDNLKAEGFLVTKEDAAAAARNAKIEALFTLMFGSTMALLVFMLRRSRFLRNEL